ncbi:MAG: hypothetical protein ACI4QT_07140 [Kiritimatiellia bacterium]
MEEMKLHDVTGSRGAQWTTAGSLIGLLATSVLNGAGGLLGGRWPGLAGGCGQAGDLAISQVLAQKDAEISGLKAEKYSDNAALAQSDRLLQNYLKPYGEAIAAGQAREAALRAEFDGFKTESALRLELVQKDVALAKQEAQCCCQQNANAIAQIAATLAGITKCVVPASAVCPAPMPLHNSWTAPTTTATA